MGQTEASNDLYETSADLLDALLSKVPTPTVERQLLSDLSSIMQATFLAYATRARQPTPFA